MDNMDKNNKKNTDDQAETQISEESTSEISDTSQENTNIESKIPNETTLDNQGESEANTQQDSKKESDINIKDDVPVKDDSSKAVPKTDFKKNKPDSKKEKNRIVKSKKEPEYLPGMQKKLFVDVRDEDELTFVDKIKAIIKDRRSIYTVSIYAIIILNLIGITLFAKKCGLNITQSLLYKVHFDSLSLDTYTFLEISILASYIFAFIFGGLVTFFMIKIASLIARNLNALYSHNFTRIIFAVFLVIFAIFTITSYVSSGGLLTIATQNWFIPLSTFAGGFCMYCISLRNVDIY